MSDLVKMDLEAMARLQPQVAGLVGQITEDLRGGVPGGGGAEGEVPSLAAAHAMSQTVWAAQLLVGQRFSQVAGLCEEARKRFVIAESQLTMAWNHVPTLLPPK